MLISLSFPYIYFKEYYNTSVFNFVDCKYIKVVMSTSAILYSLFLFISSVFKQDNNHPPHPYQVTSLHIFEYFIPGTNEENDSISPFQ